MDHGVVRQATRGKIYFRDHFRSCEFLSFELTSLGFDDLGGKSA